MAENNMNTNSPAGTSILKWALKNIAGAAAVILGVVIVAGISLRAITNHGKEITVPDFTNMKVSQAKYEAGINNVRIEVTDSVYVRRMGRGLVYSQNPKPGGKVKKGRRILLTINSVTPKKVHMPNLVGYSMRQAKAEILSLGLNIGKLIYVSDMATNNVIRQLSRNREIKPGTEIESGSEIDLVVGLNGNDNLTYVPDVTGLKYLRAKDAVHDNSLNINRIIFDKSVKTYADSLDAAVYRQTPAASQAPLLIGSEVSLYLTVDQKKIPSSR